MPGMYWFRNVCSHFMNFAKQNDFVLDDDTKGRVQSIKTELINLLFV